MSRSADVRAAAVGHAPRQLTAYHRTIAHVPITYLGIRAQY